MAPNPSEVSLTSPRSALAQRVFAGFTITAVAGGMAVLAFSDEPWWAILLWELAMLVVVVLMLALWATAGESAKETAALRARATAVVAEVLDSTRHDDGETVSHELTLWIPSGGGFQVHHRCDRYEGEQHLEVLVDPVVRTWAVVH
ncbi:hypothetical protein GCM10011609_22540 [Lentzea pudingi]|uniref:Uncharacterized protein n=1 Tax=Lentzea pudingi TaxID=1789439 RepID=A0ABQ2HLX8_9PSEU|nr:hypothetical protein [Lentzea pudingi]GGM85814.1 hypothetical protein GCM10011609_22540 [Lentzea pudingi]